MGAGIGVFLFTAIQSSFGLVILAGMDAQIGWLFIIPMAGASLGILLIGSGTIWGLVDTIRAYVHKRQFKPGQTETSRSGGWIALATGLLLFFMAIGLFISLIVFIVRIIFDWIDNVGFFSRFWSDLSF